MVPLSSCGDPLGHRRTNNVRVPPRACSLSTIVLILASATFPNSSSAQNRPRVGLVLEGGGALGFAHIGVIRWLEEHHIPVDYVAGTSMGGLVGGLYASGQSPAQIAELTDSIDWGSVLAGQR